MTFYPTYQQYKWDDVKKFIYSRTQEDVLNVLGKCEHKITLEDFATLISPAAEKYIENMAKMSHDKTRKRFGQTVQMYIPLYLSNECQNICTYCGYSLTNKIPRVTLNDQQILDEVKVIKSMGFDHVLLVTGEANKTVGANYLAHVVQLIRPYFSNISIEVQPLLQEEYETLIQTGVQSVLVYQETYNESRYKTYHPKGKKSNFKFRLDTPDRLGKAKIYKIGIGTLLGLEDWRVDSFFTALHLSYLKKTYWQTKYSISFPRLRPHAGTFTSDVFISDKQLFQLICSYRILDENLDLSISTRENALFRDNIIKFGITSMSAGSKTDPGGYVNPDTNLEQFEIDDNRTPQEIATTLRKNGYEPVWKDWEAAWT